MQNRPESCSQLSTNIASFIQSIASSASASCRACGAEHQAGGDPDGVIFMQIPSVYNFTWKGGEKERVLRHLL
jgi:hypothetical protein